MLRGITLGCTLPSEMCPHTARSRSRSSNRRAARRASCRRSDRTARSCRPRSCEMRGSRCFASADAAIDAGRHRFAQLGERCGPRVIGRQRDLRRRRARRGDRAAGRIAPAASRRRGRERPRVRATERGVSAARTIRARSAAPRRSRWQRDVELAVDAVLAHDGDRSAIDVLDRGDVDAARIARHARSPAMRRAALPRARSRRPRSGPAPAPADAGRPRAAARSSPRRRRRACLRSR